MHAIFLSSINDIPAAAWDSVWPDDYPFTQHAFLAALEDAGCTTSQTGWTPKHLVILTNKQDHFEPNNILAALPLYEKSHSYGEYVFDWGWADAYQQNGFDYYPKLLNAIPFTPATGPRLGFAQGLTGEHVSSCMSYIDQCIEQQLKQSGGSGFHSLFPNMQNRQHWSTTTYLERQSCQYHWFNRNYTDFDDFLSTFNSRKRKAVKRERKKVEEKEIVLQFRTALEIKSEEWKEFYHLYQRTYFKRSRRPGYLSLEFFQLIAAALPKQILLASAHKSTTENPMMAAALYFRDDTTLYGRYWGTQEDIDGLHFETCYYQGITYAIKHGLTRFDSGAQGEHKIQRGFTPVITSSFHKIAHPGFRDAISEFLSNERSQNDTYCSESRESLPFKDSSAVQPADALTHANDTV